MTGMAFGGDGGLCSSPAVHSTHQFLFGTSPPGATWEGMLGQARRHHPKHTSAYHEESSLHKSPESPGPSTESHPTTLLPTGGPREHACVLCHPPRGAPAAAPPQPQPGTQAGISCGRPACLDAESGVPVPQQLLGAGRAHTPSESQLTPGSPAGSPPLCALAPLTCPLPSRASPLPGRPQPSGAVEGRGQGPFSWGPAHRPP